MSLLGRGDAGRGTSGRRSQAGESDLGFALCFCLGAEAVPESPAQGDVSHSHGDPLLQRVSEVVLADGVCQRPQGRLELHHRLRQVPEPAAQCHLLLQNAPSPWKHTVKDQPSVGGASCPRSWCCWVLTCWVLACTALQGGEEQATGQGRIWQHPFRHGVEESVGLVQGGGQQLHQRTDLSFYPRTCRERPFSIGSSFTEVSALKPPGKGWRERTQPQAPSASLLQMGLV